MDPAADAAARAKRASVIGHRGGRAGLHRDQPYGFGLLRYVYENAFVPQMINIAELQPPYLPNYRGFFAWAILGGAVVALRWRTVTLAEAAAIAVFGLLGFRYLRLTPLLFLVSAPLVARCIDELKAFGVNRRAVAAAALVAAALCPACRSRTWCGISTSGRHALMPQAIFSERAMAFAREHGLEGPVFTSMNLGGFVAWELYPSARVFQDARLQAYPAAHFRAIADASASPRGVGPPDRRRGLGGRVAGARERVVGCGQVRSGGMGHRLSRRGDRDPGETGRRLRRAGGAGDLPDAARR